MAYARGTAVSLLWFPLPPFFVASLLLLTGWPLLTGCANPGPPKAPSLALPLPAKDLAADRVGADVRLHWTTPSETTDGLPVKELLTAEVCRNPPALSRSAACVVVVHLRVRPGDSTATETLPAAFLVDPVTPLIYRVHLFNGAGRSAGDSNLVVAASGAAPPPIAGLRAAVAANGVQLTWSPAGAPSTTAVMLQRTNEPDVTSSEKVPASILAKSKSGGGAGAESAVVDLLAAAAGPDPGGTVDATALRDHRYRYVAWRERSVALAGKALLLRSDISPALSATFHDVAPPDAPAGLEAVADGKAIDLSWEPNAEPDLAGYLVERAASPPVGKDQGSSRPTTSWLRITASPLEVPGFRDTSPAILGALRYRVFAVDRAGNVSLPSAPAVIELHLDRSP